MWCRIGRFEFARCAVRPAPRRREANAGFTLIEVLVAIAVLAVVLGAIGALVGTTVRSVRAIDRRLPLLETAQNLLATLPDRASLQPGTQSGVTGDFRWRVDIVALTPPPSATGLPDLAASRLGTSSFATLNTSAPNAATPGADVAAAQPKWMPVAITVRVQGREGGPLRLDTVRLVPRPAG
jgi:general secretion pathway protein I